MRLCLNQCSITIVSLPNAACSELELFWSSKFKLYVPIGNFQSQNFCGQKIFYQTQTVASMLVTDVENQLSWWQLQHFGDIFGDFDHQNPLPFYISVKLGTNCQNISPRSKFCRQHPKNVANFKSPTSLSQYSIERIFDITGFAGYRKCRRRRMFATNRFVTSACSVQYATLRLRSITSWHMFVTVNVSLNTYACHEVHFDAKFM